jgi:type VI secretion system secreted protein Hcp
MKRIVWRYVLLLVIGITIPGIARAALYLKFDGIDGEVTAQGHEKWIELSSFSFGVSAPSTSGGAGGGKARFSDVAITQLQDSTTPKEFEDLVKGTHIATGILDLVSTSQGKPFTYFKYTFSDILLASINISSGGDRPTESLSFDYTKIKLEAFKQNAIGQVSLASVAEFDLTHPSAAPEPSTWALLTGGLLLVIARGRKLMGSRKP